MNIRTFMSIFATGLLFTASSVAMAGISLKINPDSKPDIPAGTSQNVNLYDDNAHCTSQGGIVFSLDEPITDPYITAAISFDASFASNGQFTFDNAAGFLTTDDGDFKVKFRADCGDGSADDNKSFKPSDSGGGSTPSPTPAPAPTPGVLTLGFSPSATTVTLSDNGTKNWTANGGNGSTCPGTDVYTYALVGTPIHGTVTLDPSFTTNGVFSYDNDGSGGGFLGASSELISITVSCGADTPASDDIRLSKTPPAPTITCTGSSTTGVVILDNTATPGQASIATNLAFLDGCSKGDTTIDDGYGGNAININDFHTVNRNISASPHQLDLVIGNTTAAVDDANFDTTDQLTFFADGEHLFDLDRLRAVADWISATGNVVPDAGVAAGDYGAISFQQFLSNVASARTMYGMVRVKIPLEKGERSECSSNCNMNALGQTVASASDLYGFCSVSTGLCSCAPTSNTNLETGSSHCSNTLTSTSRIKVKGSLLWDFVDHVTGAPIPLAQLPFAPRELYFKVTVPIMINWDHDAAEDGAMDNMFIIKAVTNGGTAGPVPPSPSINFSDIPQSSKDNYLYETGSVLDATEFATLNEPNKYHLLMASGYADGWAEAFDKLNITAATWATLPTSTDCAVYTSTTCDLKLSVPYGVTAIMTADNVRDGGFEDLPTYLYSGGLIDMHGHVNISGLLYVPQAMELEAKDSGAPTQQYVSGAIIVRDGFYIEAKDNTITVISSDPNSYSTARTNSSASSTRPLSFNSSGPGVTPSTPSTPSTPGTPSPPSGGDNSCIGCGGGSGGGGGGGG
ncbi:MAG: hypothetical protein COB30_004345, partial [Ectothiorhodospiraceae bacterium]|nr:hypothetical protein [Ectothiorhodospiraceae bacterium]